MGPRKGAFIQIDPLRGSIPRGGNEEKKTRPAGHFPRGAGPDFPSTSYERFVLCFWSIGSQASQGSGRRMGIGDAFFPGRIRGALRKADVRTLRVRSTSRFSYPINTVRLGPV